MKVIERLSNSMILELSEPEVEIIHAALNEVCNGIDVPEFHARIGAGVGEVRKLLFSLGSLLPGL